MLGLSLGQVAANILAILFGARLAMRAGRDLRADIFRTVGDFSEQDVQRFGAASLITRNTNDVQQVQMLILMSCTMLLSGADARDRRRRSWPSAPTRRSRG